MHKSKCFAFIHGMGTWKKDSETGKWACPGIASSEYAKVYDTKLHLTRHFRANHLDIHAQCQKCGKTVSSSPFIKHEHETLAFRFTTSML